MWYSNLPETFISRHILHQHGQTLTHCFTNASKPAATVLSATFAPPCQPLRHQRNVGHPDVNRFMRQTLPTVNRNYFFMNILCIESFCPQKRTTERCSSVLHSSSMVTILTTKTSFWTWRLRFCYVAGLCCYLVTYIENLLHSLQLFYFRLWPVYWLSLVHDRKMKIN
jgi:hypothetical protein